MRDTALVTVAQVPLQTTAGLCWHIPVTPPRGGGLAHKKRKGSTCYYCPMEPHCRDAVARGDFVACERPLRWEVL